MIIAEPCRLELSDKTSMPRAAIYSRFSTDLQNERSVDDQVALCRAYCAREGLTVTATYDDKARSGASIFGRDGLIDLMAQAKARAFDVVVVEALDRLSRDMEDLAGIHKRLSFAGVEIRAVHDGRADTVMVGLRGLVGQLFREDGAKKVRRGMVGVVRSGRHAGGRAYGYRPVPGEPGMMQIFEPEAEVVRGIMRDYLDGAMPREIAAALNRANVPPPRGRVWSTVTIYGNKARGHGILANPIYDGRIAWNRVRMIKDPDTGRRVSRPNPESDWHWADAPRLRIVDEEVFAAVQSLKARKSIVIPQHRRKPKHLLSGLLRCSVCGGGMSKKDVDHGRPRIVCTQSHNTGTCENKRPYYLDAIERGVLAGLKDHLGSRAAIDLYLKTYNAERKRLASSGADERDRLVARLREVETQRDRTLQGFTKGFVSEEDAGRILPALKDEQERLVTELAALGSRSSVIELHPTAVAAYLDAIDDVRSLIAAGGQEGSEASKNTLRDLIETVTVFPPTPKDGVAIEVTGQLASLIGGRPFPSLRVSGVWASNGPPLPNLATGSRP